MATQQAKWMVRTSDNVLAGPFTIDDIQSLAESRGLILDDELCQANGYWFYLHDQEEVRNQLGSPIKFSSQGDPHEEITQTETASAETKTFIEIGEPSKSIEDESSGDLVLDIESVEDESSFEEGVMENRAFREIKKPQAMIRKYQPVHRPHTTGTQTPAGKKIERSTVYKIMIALLLGFIAFSLVALWRLLNK